MKISFNVQIWREGKVYIAYVPELDISSCGKTSEKARKNIDEAVDLFLEEAKKIGTLEQILKEANFEKRNGNWEAPDLIIIEKKELVLA